MNLLNQLLDNWINCGKLKVEVVYLEQGDRCRETVWVNKGYVYHLLSETFIFKVQVALRTKIGKGVIRDRIVSIRIL